MRDPKRIDKFCSELAELWHKVPDWRFGQFLCNVFGDYKRDLFFPEDEELMTWMKEYFKEDK